MNMKEILKRLGIQLAVNSAFVAADQAVRTVVSHALKSHVLKDRSESQQK